MTFDLVLASASPRRRELLGSLGLAVRSVPSGLPEPDDSDVEPSRLARDLARAKALHVAHSLRPSPAPRVVLGADTVVAVGARVFGKPRDDAAARAMLKQLRGREHRVITAAHVLRVDTPREAELVETTRVRFRGYDDRTIAWYVASGEPRDKAGAYAIQGLGVLLVEAVHGSWSNVVGLPLERLPELFAEIGLDLLEAIGAARGT